MSFSVDDATVMGIRPLDQAQHIGSGGFTETVILDAKWYRSYNVRSLVKDQIRYAIELGNLMYTVRS